ncbi:DUF6603 domain-containing protein [Chitinophaga sp. LS1]|uniref:DUF6603 domain-containing protein n=1 Tax=Chitinophaga sp. LS1 TaxID=3051176 RepID=UPI002AAB2EE4|nr:DUF6603 domain-containing protein [Chitinophaga sp. LS1]WPV64832.1 hypothetical protein QQL36_23805 [Chitinophaga sp. LS1]
MPTNVDLTTGINLEIGSVPVSLAAELTTTDTATTYTFNGCVQNAVIDIGTFISFVGQQFGVNVLLPPELNLEAIINYVAGQVIYTSPKTGNATTELGVSASFELEYSNGSNTDKVTLSFYADSIIQSGATGTNPYVVGAAIDTDLAFKNLPLVGDIPVFNEYTLKHIGFSYTNADPKTTGKPVNFHIPKVNTTANPLYTRTIGDGKEKNNYSIDTKGDQTAFTLTQGGFSLTAGLMREGSATAENNFALPLALPAATPGNTPASYYNNPANKVQTSPPASPVHWINVNKTFGPVSLQKVGLNYASGEATFGISAGMSMGGFTLDVQGLCITFPFPLPGMPAGNEVTFDIQGLGMDFTEPGLEIGGAFLKTVDPKTDITNYFGEVIVQIAEFGFKAVGGYAPAQNSNPAAFFIYANLEVPLGGPPFFYVSGLAFGFGVNYALILPTIDTLPTYLLLPNMAPPQGNAEDALSSVIGQLQNGSVIKYEAGEYWVGFGVQFTSFDMISAFAMVTFSFGVDMQVALLGSCAIVLPEGSPDALASIQVNLVAAITPSTGLINVTGVITPASYIFGPFVKLSGGFAFYLWFAGEHQGDFVVSLGGYHPAFNKPEWYPDVPRIRVTFNLGPFQASGSSYLALTPSMFMAGMSVAATYDATVVKVWFNMGADFLISWSPFQYEADAYVNIGCDLNVGLFTIKIHVGADLQLWGPPFGGHADVDLDVITITIQFGSTAAAPVPVTWQNLEQNFLPPPVKTQQPAPQPQQRLMSAVSMSAAATDTTITTNVSASVSTGLLGKDATSQDGETWNWLLDPDNFNIVTTTTIPANMANWATGATTNAAIPNDPTQYNGADIDTSSHPYYDLPAGTETYSKTQVWNPNVNVKPMKLSNVQSVHTITLCKRESTDKKGQFSDYRNNVSVDPVLGSSNTALWGDPALSSNDANTPALLTQTLLGFNITPVPRNPDTVNNVPLIDLLFTSGEQTNFSYMSPQPDTSYTLQVKENDKAETLDITVSGTTSQELDNSSYVLSAFINTWVNGQRNAILDDLNDNGWNTYASSLVTLTNMGSTEMLTDWPMIAILETNNAA